MKTSYAEDGYIIVTWPESQDLMDQSWFDECILLNTDSELEEYGSSAYYVPENRYYELIK